MHILVHDFAGYPFPVQLSRALASRGHKILHVHSAGLQGPKGALSARPEDPESFGIRAVPLARSFRKYSFHRRALAHYRYASDLMDVIAAEKPDVVISGDTPIDVQMRLQGFCRSKNVVFVHWIQDIYSKAVGFVLRQRFGPLGELAAGPFRWMEASVARNSDAVVVIASAFRDLLAGVGVPPTRMTVIENWGPLEEIPVANRDNPWRSEVGLRDRLTFLYSGTLGLKHRPDLIYKLASSLGRKADVVVVSEGVGRDYLSSLPPLDNLRLLDFQPYARVPETLASADVLLGTLETDAGDFAVPSKILAYLCAGRPIVLAAPQMNLSAQVVRRAQAGFTVDTTDENAWLNAAHALAEDPSMRAAMGRRARAYAEQAFDIRSIAGTFERVVAQALPAAVSIGTPAFNLSQ